MEVAFVGGGITALSSAFLIKKYFPNYKIYIIDKDLGGKIKTKIIKLNNQKYFIELGPDSLVYNEKFQKINIEFSLNNLNIIFSNINPNYVFYNNKIYKIPDNILDFILSNSLSFKSKFKFILNLFNEIKYNENDTLKIFCEKNFDTEFNEKILYPLFSNVFFTDIEKLSIIPLIPYLKNIKKNILKNTKTKFFNFKHGLSSLVEYFYNYLTKNNTIFINENLLYFDIDINKTDINENNKIYILKTENHYIKVSKVFFTVPAFNLNEIIINSLNKSKNLTQNIEILILLKELINLIKNISYHSSFIYILIFNKILSFKGNGLLFNNHDLFKAISFFSKKWNNIIDNNNSNTNFEFVRVFFKYNFNQNLDILLKELNKIDLFKNIKLENLQYSEYVVWENSILTNDTNLFNVSKKIQENIDKLKNYNIFILANFIKGSSIVDRLYNSINYINELKGKF